MKLKTRESNVGLSQKEMNPEVENSIGAGDLTKDLESAQEHEAVVHAVWGRFQNGHVLCQK
jgi:hypothetical protein